MENSTSSKKPSANWQNWFYFGTRWLLLVVMLVAIFAGQKRAFENISDLALVFAVGAVANIVLGIFTAVPALRDSVMYVGVPTDWLIAGGLVYVSLNNPDPTLVRETLINQQALVVGAAGATAVMGFIRFGTSLGVIHTVGVLVVIGIAQVVAPDINIVINNLPVTVLPTLLITLLLAASVGMWVHRVYGFNAEQRQYLKDTVKQQQAQLKNMREQTRAVSEMADKLNSTLDYEDIMDAALDLGRMIIRQSERQRVVSMVLMYTPTNRLEISSSRGLSYVDESKIFAGTSGIIADTLNEAQSAISNDGEADPELSQLVGFRGIRSVLCIPLRAGLDNFGVLIYATDRKNIFSNANIDTLTAIGIQTTFALHNALLYRNLKDDKEKLIEMEERARKELVRDLHDVPTQTISAVVMRLPLIIRMIERGGMEEQVKQELEEAHGLASRATEEIRHVMFALRPLALESSGLAVALKQLGDKMETTHHQKMSIRVAPEAEKLLSSKAQSSLFYLIEEASNNARKHAQAALIKVTIDREGEFIILRIADNGGGFDMAQVDSSSLERGSFGMVNMRERAELIEGVLEMKSSIGKGTTITVAVPVDAKLEAAVKQAEAEPETKMEAAARKRLKMM